MLFRSWSPHRRSQPRPNASLLTQFPEPTNDRPSSLTVGAGTINAEAGSYGLTVSASSMLDEVVMLLEPSLRDSEGIWTVDYVRLRFEAHLPDD